jgi:hypothetical protein
MMPFQWFSQLLGPQRQPLAWLALSGDPSAVFSTLQAMSAGTHKELCLLSATPPRH